MKQRRRKQAWAFVMSLLIILQVFGQSFCLYGETVSSNDIASQEMEEGNEEAEIEVALEEDGAEPEEETETKVQEYILDTQGNSLEVSFSADFQVQSQWDNEYNGTITLRNTSKQTIENWILSFETKDSLGSFYNGTVASQEDGVYVIKNCGWNRDIAPGESVSFGFAGQFTEEICSPDQFKLLSVLQTVESGAQFQWSLSSEWTDGYTGEMWIINTGEEDIEDWRLTFAPGAELVNLWNATLISTGDGAYTVRSNSYNSVIKPGERVSFGFQAKGTWEQVPTPEVVKFEQNTLQKGNSSEEDEEDRDIEEEIAQEFEALGIIYAENDNEYAVTKDVTLPSEGVWGSVVTWESSDENVISTQGKVTRGAASQSVTLTATIQNGDLTMQKVFDLWVIKKEVSEKIEAVTYEDVVSWNEEGDLQMYSMDGGETMSHLYGRFTEGKIETEQEAINAVWSVAQWIGANEETDSFRLLLRYSDEADTTFRLAQYYKGLEVVGGQVIVGTDENGYGDYLSSCYQMNIDLDVEPNLSEENLHAILEDSYAECIINSSKLAIYDPVEEYCLVWFVDAVLDGEYYEVLIEDATGEVLSVDSGECYASQTTVYNEDRSEVARGTKLSKRDMESSVVYVGYVGEYLAEDKRRNICVRDAEQTTSTKNKKIAQSEDVVFEDDVVFYSLKNFAITYDYYLSKLHRNSFDGVGGKITVHANFRKDANEEWCNARYEPNTKTFQVGSGNDGGYAKGLDVIAHEFTHGVLHHRAPINYKREDAKAIDEAYADIIGGVIEAQAMQKEEWWIHGDSYRAGGSRNLQDPHKKFSPKVYGGQYWYVGDNIQEFCHTNSTVISHAAYLIQQELGLTMDETAELWYESMAYIDPKKDNNNVINEEDINYFFRVREAVEEVAEDKLSYTEEQMQTIGNIFDRVGIPDQRKQFNPNVDTTGYDYVIMGIIVQADDTLADAEKKRVKDCKVTISYYGKNGVDVSPNGLFAAKVNIARNYTVTIEKEGYLKKRVEVEMQEDKINYDLGYIELEAYPVDVMNRVYDDQSEKEIKGLKLYLRKGKNQHTSKVLAEGVTDEEGICLWKNLYPGDYCVQVVDEREDEDNPYEMRYFNITVEAGETTQEIPLFMSRLKDVDVKTGVYDAKTGEKVQGLTLCLRRGKDKHISYVMAKGTTNAAGICLWRDLYPGDYCVQVIDEREDKDEDEEAYKDNYFNITVEADETMQEISLFMSRPEYKKEYEGNTYQLFGAWMTWEEAEVYCKQNGGHLVCIGSEEENNFLSEWLKEENMDYVSIGYTDREIEDEWVWLNEEDPAYENWNAGEPNDGLDIYANQNYAYMYKNGTWDDGRNYAKKPFFCEWESEEEEK